MCFSIYNNVYPRYCQSYKKTCQSMELETLSLQTIINELFFLRKTVIKTIRNNYLSIKNF